MWDDTDVVAVVEALAAATGGPVSAEQVVLTLVERQLERLAARGDLTGVRPDENFGPRTYAPSRPAPST